MDKVVQTVKSSIGGLFAVLTSVIGLLVLAQVVFGEEAGMNVISNLQAIVNGFVGPTASLLHCLASGLLDCWTVGRLSFLAFRGSSCRR